MLLLLGLLLRKMRIPELSLLFTLLGPLILYILFNVGTSINLISLVAYKLLGLRSPKLMSLRLLMVDQTVKKKVGISCNVLVKVAFFIYPTNFVIVNYDVDFDILIIFGRPFLDTGRELVDMEMVHIKFRLNNEHVTFNIG